MSRIVNIGAAGAAPAPIDTVDSLNINPTSSGGPLRPDANGNVTIPGLLYITPQDGISAVGTTQGTAFQLTKEFNRITAGSGGGLMLPPLGAGLDLLVINHSGGSIQMYGNGTDMVDDVAAATGVTQMNGSMCFYASTANGSWYSNGIGTGYSGSFPTMSYSNGLIANPGGGQTNALLLTTALNRVTTIATAGDSVKLPVAAGGMMITGFNAHPTNAMAVFPNVGDAINALAANAAFSVAPGKTATFFSTLPGFWHVMLSA